MIIRKGIHLDAGSKGTRGVWIEGDYAVGIDMGSNSIRLNKDTKIILEETGQVFMRYNSGLSRIEFVYGSNVLGYIPLTSLPHAL